MAAAAQHARRLRRVPREARRRGTTSPTPRKSLHDDVAERHALAAHRARAAAERAHPSGRAVWQIAAADRPHRRPRRRQSGSPCASASEQRAFDRAILRDQALDEVEACRAGARRGHRPARESSPTPKLDEPSTPLLVSYKEKLMLLDDAIAECETNIEQNRQQRAPPQTAPRHVLRETADAAGRAAGGKPCHESVNHPRGAHRHLGATAALTPTTATSMPSRTATLHLPRRTA